jgi:DNA-binding transcriptional regulator YiaG
VCEYETHPREGWDQAFANVAARGDNQLLDDSWDQEWLDPADEHQTGEHGTLVKLIIESLEEAIRHARGEDTGARVLPPVESTGARKAYLEGPPWYPPHVVREVRHKLSVSQAIFAQMMGVSASTVRAWEQGKREPEGAARRLLQIAELHPDVFKETCGPIRPATKGATPLPRTVKAPAAPRPRRLAADTGGS